MTTGNRGKLVMKSTFRAVAILVMAGVVVVLVSMAPTWARQWRTTPQAQATDYAEIIDQRSPQETVMLIWLNPMMFPDDASSQPARQLLSKYMLLGIVHADIGIDGNPVFRKIQGINIETNKSTLHDSLDEDVLPPTVIGMLKGLQALFQQILGPLGRGTHWFVFDGADLPPCGKGGFVVPYAGVRYGYDTPVPGCPRA
jgi:hypothetical protein